MPNETFGSYTIYRQIPGAGGEAYLASRIGEERKVVLRLPQEHRFANRKAKKRFLEDLEKIAGLKHPNIAELLDFGKEDGRPFAVFRYINGRNVELLIHDRGILAVSQSIDIVKQAARALSAAHRLRISHKHLRPSSLLVDASNTVFVSDFGLARISDPERVKGYQAPETSKSVASDVYSLGAIFYQLVTGEFVTPGSRTSAHEIHGGLSKEFSDLIDRMIEKNPVDRIDSMEEVILVLQQYRAGFTSVRKKDDTELIQPPGDEGTALELDIPDELQ